MNSLSNENIRPSFWWLWCVLVVFLLTTASTFVSASSRGENAVKAAFIHNIILLTEWPEHLSGDGNNEIVLCVAGKTSIPKPFTALSGKKMGDMELRVVPAHLDTTLPRCHVLFFTEDVDTESLVRMLGAVRSQPVLTIGEKPNVTKLGGAVHFYKDQDRLRFVINPQRIAEQGLTMSSRLLQIATLIHD